MTMCMKLVAMAMAFLSATLGATPQEEAMAYVNARLSHSRVQSIDAAGSVRIKSPSDTYTFNLKEVAFGYNDRNNDARLRIASHHRLGDGHRQSFVCRDGKSAKEAIAAFRRLRNDALGQDPGYKHLFRKLNPDDKSLTFTTVGEALDFVNDRLQVSVITRLDGDGFLYINSSDDTYRVDLRRAEFCLNDSGDTPKVRIYGDWVIEIQEEDQSRQASARESFSTDSRRETFEVIRTLYLLRATFGGMRADQIPTLRNLSPSGTRDPRTLQGLLDTLNDKLAISRALGVDERGILSLNTSECIYRIDLHDATFERAREDGTLRGWLKRTFEGGRKEGVTIRSSQGLKRFERPESYKRVEEETFSCESAFESQDAVDTLLAIQKMVRAGAKS